MRDQSKGFFDPVALRGRVCIWGFRLLGLEMRDLLDSDGWN